jgi:glyoxylase-like metal-dependent hydrolase (beta-lactamase superfamily II)
MGDIRVVTLPMPLRMGTVNAYLIDTDHGFILIDTGPSSARRQLEQELAGAGCKPGNVALIVLTHGDFDHTGNAAYLRDRFGAKIAMHQNDVGMAEQADMFWNRQSGNPIMRFLAPILFGFRRSNRFTPDLRIDEGDSLSGHGLDADVLSIPGHSKGSIGILTAKGDLFCGDLLENTKQPARNSIMDDGSAYEVSIERLTGLSVSTVYPGHGAPFSMVHFASGAQGSKQV